MLPSARLREAPWCRRRWGNNFRGRRWEALRFYPSDILPSFSTNDAMDMNFLKDGLNEIKRKELKFHFLVLLAFNSTPFSLILIFKIQRVTELKKEYAHRHMFFLFPDTYKSMKQSNNLVFENYLQKQIEMR